MSMRCKQCGESFAKGTSHDVWEIRRQHVVPADGEGLVNSTFLTEGGVYCSRKCVTDYLNAGDSSGVFGLGSRKV